MRKYERPKVTMVELRVQEALVAHCKTTDSQTGNWSAGSSGCQSYTGDSCPSTGS